MRLTTPQQTGRARGARLCSEAALLRGASNPFSHYPNPRVLVQSLGRCLSSSSGGSVRPLLQHGPRSEKPSERWIISHRPPALSVPPVLSLCLTLLVPHCVSLSTGTLPTAPTRPSAPQGGNSAAVAPSHRKRARNILGAHSSSEDE